MHGGVSEFFVNAFHPADVLAGSFKVHIRVLVAAVVPLVKKHVQNICNAIASIVLVKDITSVGWKTPNSSEIYYPPDAATIL